MFRLSKRDTLLQLFSSVVSAVIPIAISYLAARLIDEIVKLVTSDISSIYELKLTSPLIVIILLTVAATFVNRVVRNLREYVGERFDYLHFDLFNVEVLSRISTLDIVQFEDAEVSNDIRKARDNSYKIYYFASSSVDVLVSIITAVISGVIVFSVSPIIFLLIIILSLPNNIIYARYISKIWNFYNSEIERNRTFWWSLDFLSEDIKMPEHKITDSNDYLSKIIMRLRNDLSTIGINIRKKRFIESILASLLNSVTYIVTPLFLVSRMLAGAMSIGQFTFYQGSIFSFSDTLEKMLGQILGLADAAAYLTYVRRLFEMEPAIKSGTKKISNTEAPLIEFRDVSFKYSKSNTYALRHVNLTIKQGEEIAIVGENGAGKTTLIKLLLRFYEPTEGTILINGDPIESLDTNSYRNLFGALFQEYNRYEPYTVKDNIMIGDHRAPLSISKLRSAAKQADAQTFIEKLDYKYEEKLAKQFTHGTNLSTGQWQKIALARMFYRDRPILILDEPTASIDAEAEYRIFQRIYNFTEIKTIIIISHRFSTVRNAKRIYVLNKGELVEQGSHEELMHRNGRYTRAFKLQAKGYQAKQ
jgi:ATP-binding cassette, subfamily B, bacterial